MIIEGTSWNFEDVASVDLITFVSEQMKGSVYKKYKETDRIKLFEMVYYYAVSGSTGAVHPPLPS